MPPDLVTWSRELSGGRSLPAAPRGDLSCRQRTVENTAFPALGGSYQSNDNTAVQRLLKQNPLIP